MHTLSNGTLLCAFDANDDNGGNTVIKLVRSTDSGKTWSSAVKVSSTPSRNCANPAIWQLKNGEILVAYRAIAANGSNWDSAIQVSVSEDGGYTWKDHSTVISYTNNQGGVYEPQFVDINGVLNVFYANDSVGKSSKIGTGSGAPAVTSRRYQNIEYMQYSNGSWVNRSIACNGNVSKSRDGMPAVTRLSNGSYALAFEASAYESANPAYPFILEIKYSSDGLTWQSSPSPQTLIVPSVAGRKAGAPYLVTLPNGRVALSYQTDEKAVEEGDSCAAMRVVFSKNAQANTWGEIVDPFSTPGNLYSAWNSLIVHGNYLIAATSTNSPRNSICIRRADLNNLPAAN